jgi:hypothetical protein
MAQDFIVVAACVVQGVGQGGHSVERSVVIVRLGELDHGGRQPSGVESDGAEGAAEDVPQQHRLRQKFASLSSDSGLLATPAWALRAAFRAATSGFVAAAYQDA